MDSLTVLNVEVLRSDLEGSIETRVTTQIYGPTIKLIRLSIRMYFEVIKS